MGCSENIAWETFFLKNHQKYAVEELFPDPFLENQNEVYSWISNLKFYTVCFYCMPSWELSKYIETKLQTTCFYFIEDLKNKKRSETSLSPSFSAWFLQKIASNYILLNNQILLSVPLLSEILSNMCIVIVC